MGFIYIQRNLSQLKKIFILAAIALGVNATCYAQSETFKAFKLDISFGKSFPSGENAKSGFAMALEPKFAINDKLTFGIRLETAASERDISYARSIDEDVSFSYLATADYYLNTNGFRPFAGFGAGIHRIASGGVYNATTDTYNNDNVAIGSVIGFSPRAGFESGHFRMVVEYNYVGKTDGFNNSYIGFKTGFFIGGGRK